MIKKEHLIADMKQIKREPILLLFALLPILLVVIFGVIIRVGLPYIDNRYSINLIDYKSYFVSFYYLILPTMLGTIIGFFMLDEKDAKIFELLRVTPLGYTGYLLNRLLLPAILTSVYVVMGYILLGNGENSYITLFIIIIWICIQTIGVGLFVALVSDDKVKGLTYAKAVSGLIMFGFVDLFPLEFVRLLGRFTPYFYVTEIILHPTFLNAIYGTLVHVVWLGFVIWRNSGE